MAWYTDEEYEYRQDTRDKAITARSARHTRTHCGKGGAVKFPSDNLTKKERESMNGECKTYRMNAPLSWDEFKSMPDDLKIVYVKALRKKYNVPDKVLGKAMGVCQQTFARYIKDLKLGLGKAAGAASRKWNDTKEANCFWTWWNGVKLEKNAEDAPRVSTPIDDNDIRQASELIKRDLFTSEETENVVEETESVTEATTVIEDDTCYRERLGQKIVSEAIHKPLIPHAGEMNFTGNVSDILTTIDNLLGNTRVGMKIEWVVLEEEIDVESEKNPSSENVKKRLKECLQAARYALLNAERRESNGSNG